MHRLQFSGPAQVFVCEVDCFAAVEARQIKEGSVIVIRNVGPKGGPDMPEMLARSEDRCVGEARASTFRSRWSHYIQNKIHHTLLFHHCRLVLSHVTYLLISISLI